MPQHADTDEDHGLVSLWVLVAVSRGAGTAMPGPSGFLAPPISEFYPISGFPDIRVLPISEFCRYQTPKYLYDADSDIRAQVLIPISGCSDFGVHGYDTGHPISDIRSKIGCPDIGER
jgi:hypothetical protein